MEGNREEKAMELGYDSFSEGSMEEKSEFAPWHIVQQDTAASSNSTNTNSTPEYFELQDHSIKMLVVCSSPNSTFSRQKDIVKIHFPPKIEIIFLDGRKYKTFPQDLVVPDNYLDAIWFCGCNVIDDIFSSTFDLKRRWLSIFNNKLRFGGRVFFTESEKFVKETCDGTIKNPSIFMDINCYKNHKLSGHLVTELTTFLKLFQKNEHQDFIYYTKKDKPGSQLWTNRRAKMKSSKRSRASADAAAGRSWATTAFLPAQQRSAADAQRRSEVAAAAAAAAGGLMVSDDGNYDNKEPLGGGWEQSNPDWAEAAADVPPRAKKRAWYDPRRYFKGSGRNTRRRKRRRRRRRTRRKTRRRKRVKKRTRRRRSRKKRGGHFGNNIDSIGKKDIENTTRIVAEASAAAGYLEPARIRNSRTRRVSSIPSGNFDDIPSKCIGVLLKWAQMRAKGTRRLRHPKFWLNEVRPCQKKYMRVAKRRRTIKKKARISS